MFQIKKNKYYTPHILNFEYDGLGIQFGLFHTTPDTTIHCHISKKCIAQMHCYFP